jgi:hypothetical protein
VKYTVDKNGFVNIRGSCQGYLARTGGEVPNGAMPIRFNRIGLDFIMTNTGLTSLMGSPKQVGRNFLCGSNKLTSLEGSPTNVPGNFVCYDNQLIDLSGCPKTVGGDFECQKSGLKSLLGAPQSVQGTFDCSSNDLESLEGCSKIIGGTLRCSNNPLRSLRGLPDEVRHIVVSWTPDLPLLQLVGRKFKLIGETMWQIPPEADKIMAILTQYSGASRYNIIACQKELINAGFEGNASW